MDENTLRSSIMALARERYGTEAEYLWAKTPTYGVLRHPNGKWYAAVLDVPKNKLGMEDSVVVDILNVRCDPRMAGALCQQLGIFPGYHMNKEHWVTILLDGSVDLAQIGILLDMSYNLAEAKSRRKT